jgi:DNA-binding MarR family transcriptional regulator
MNYQSSSTQSPAPDLQQQAQLLAGLTHNLAFCCIGKESELFNRYGLSSSEGHVLLTLSEHGSVTPSFLAARLGVGRSRMTPLVQSLVDSGFVSRTESLRDRRVRNLTLTSRGQEVAYASANFRTDFHARLLERFPERERDNLLSTLSILHDRIRQLRDELKDDDHSESQSQ